MRGPTMERIATVTVALVALVVVLALALLLVDVLIDDDLLDDDVSASLAAFVGGIVGALTYVVTRWLAIQHGVEPTVEIDEPT